LKRIFTTILIIIIAAVLSTACFGGNGAPDITGESKEAINPNAINTPEPKQDTISADDKDKIIEWSKEYCLPINNKMKQKPKLDIVQASYLHELKVEVNYGDYVFYLPEGWKLDGSLIMKGQEVMGEIRHMDYDANVDQIPTFLPDEAHYVHCSTTNQGDRQVRMYELALTDIVNEPKEYQRHFQFFEYGPLTNRIYSFIFYGSIDYQTGHLISSTFRLPYDLDAEKALITLDSEPRIRSPRRVLVGPEEQNYTIQFREPMNRESVETAIRQGGIVYGPQRGNTASGELHEDMAFHFKWENNKLLKLSVTLKKNEDLIRYRDYQGVWIGNNHNFAYTTYLNENGQNVMRMLMYDVDKDNISILIPEIGSYSRIIGSSKDGNWIYLETNDTAF
jgi:hypothetical protein